MKIRRIRRRALLAVLAAVLGILSLGELQSWRRAHDALVDDLRETGLVERRPEVAQQIAREPDPGWARVRLARAILADELEPSWILKLPPKERMEQGRRSFERLARAREMAQSALAERPASWEAAMVLGEATYLDLLRRQDPRRFETPEHWTGPLLAAHRISPIQPEPVELLAADDLSSWSGLSPVARKEARAFLRQAFSSRGLLHRLASLLVRSVPDAATALSLVPDAPWAGEELAEAYARLGRRSELEAALAARQR